MILLIWIYHQKRPFMDIEGEEEEVGEELVLTHRYGNFMTIISTNVGRLHAYLLK